MIIVQSLFDYIQNICENELMFKRALWLLIILVGTIAIIFIIKKSVVLKYRYQFPKCYGNIRLTRNIKIKKRKEIGENYFKLRYPYWKVSKSDGTADLRVSHNEIIWQNSKLYVEKYIVISKFPLEVYSVVKELRVQGIKIRLSCEEKKKKVKLEKRKRIFINDGNIQNIIDYYSATPTDFEKLCAKLFKSMGYKYKLTPPTNDGGYDILLQKDRECIIVECKCYSQGKNIGRPSIQKLVGANQIVQAERMLFVTTSDFSTAAVNYAETIGVELINGYGLLKLLEKKGFLEKEKNITISDEECELEIRDMREYVPKDIYKEYFL